MAAVKLSTDDVLALEAIAALDDEAGSPSGESQTDEDDVLDTYDDDLIDPDLGDEELVAASFLESAADGDETGPETERGPGKYGTWPSSTVPTVPSTALNNALKRPSSSEQPTHPGDDDRPAKLNKSFSEGLDEALGRISLDTILDEELGFVPKPPSPKAPKAPREASVDEQLAIEDEINQALASQHATQSSVPSLPQFIIPTDVLKRLIASNTADKPSYWSHTLYRGPHGQCVTVQYCKTIEQTERVAQSFLTEPVVGFDMEWAWGMRDKSPDLKRQVSLIQVACEDRIALFHIALHAGNTVDDLIAPSLRKLIETPKIVKTGVSVFRADGSRLIRHFGLQPRGLIELSNLFQVVYYADAESLNGTLRSMALQVQTVLKLPLLKDEVRTSNWAKELNAKQIQYAADDAYAGYMLYRVMEAKRRVLRPSRPRPEFAELNIPMRRQYAPSAQDDSPSRRVAKASDGVPHSKSSPQEPTFDDERHAQLYKALCEHRASALRAEGRPEANDNFNVHVLRNVAVARPEDMEALSRVRGVGPVRIATYGEAWLGIIHKHKVLWTVAPSSDAGFRKPPELPAHLQSPPGMRTRASPGSPMQESLFVELQKLRAGLAENRAAKGFELPGDETLKALAHRRPVDRSTLVLVPGGPEMDQLTSRCGIDLLEFMARHVFPPRAQGQHRKSLRDSINNDDDDDCFEIMTDKRLTTTTARWVV